MTVVPPCDHRAIPAIHQRRPGNDGRVEGVSQLCPPRRLTTGELLNSAEAAGFDILLTADKGFQHQQNLSHWRIAVVILNRGNWPDVKMNIPKILDAIEDAKGGTCTVVEGVMSSGTFMEEDAP